MYKVIVNKLLEKVTPTNVLDLGCGDLRKTSIFAREGIKVTAIDLKKFEKVDYSKVNFIQEDIRSYVIKDKYDLIILSGILHMLNKDEALKIINNVMFNTLKGGYNFLVLMTNKDKLAIGKDDKFYPDVDHIIKFYKGWEVIDNITYLTPVESHPGYKKPHRHHWQFVLFKKVN